jgi:ATP-dependent DNA helicase RecQ
MLMLHIFQTDVKNMLSIENCIIFRSTFNRPNLFYEVRSKKANAEEAVDDIAGFIAENYPKESGIIYCMYLSHSCRQLLNILMQVIQEKKRNMLPTNCKREELRFLHSYSRHLIEESDFLSKAACYHANSDPRERDQVHKKWIDNKIQVV